MGLDIYLSVKGDAYHKHIARWSYGGFDYFRKALAKELGIDLRVMEGYSGTKSWTDEPMQEFFCHEDCDGVFTKRQCLDTIPVLESLLPLMDEYDQQEGYKLLEGMVEVSSGDGRKSWLSFR